MHCPRLLKVCLKVKKMPDTTSLFCSRPGAIMAIVFNLQIKVMLRGPALTHWNRNKYSISFPRRRLIELSANYTAFECKVFILTFKCRSLSFLCQCFVSASLSTMVYLHPDLVLPWISSLMASLRTLFSSFHSQILLLNYLSTLLLFYASRSWPWSSLYFVSYLVLLCFPRHTNFSIVSIFPYLSLWYCLFVLCNMRCDFTEDT